jgi:hypothetical protein
MKKQKNQIIAEFRIEDLLGIGFTLIVLAIGLAYGLNVLGDIKDDIGVDACPSGFSYSSSQDVCLNSSYTGTGLGNVTAPVAADFNATTQGIGAVGKIPEKLGLIVTVVIAAVIIGILVTYLWIKFK